MLLIYVQFSNWHLMHVLLGVRTCMNNLAPCLRGAAHSPIAAPATTWVKQNVTPWLRGSTVCEYDFQYDENLHVKNKSKFRLCCRFKGRLIFRILFSIHLNFIALFSFVSLAVEIFCCECTDKMLRLSCSLCNWKFLYFCSIQTASVFLKSRNLEK
jgi:hypothetical protein